jgi:hypothetical protein
VQVDEGTDVGLELPDEGVNASLDLFSNEFSEPRSWRYRLAARLHRSKPRNLREQGWIASTDSFNIEKSSAWLGGSLWGEW